MIVESSKEKGMLKTIRNYYIIENGVKAFVMRIETTLVIYKKWNCTNINIVYNTGRCTTHVQCHVYVLSNNPNTKRLPFHAIKYIDPCCQ